MKCPNCSNEMTAMTLDAHLSAPVTIDLCTACQVFWFDRYESLKLSPGSTLKLLKLIGEQGASGKATLSGNPRCPRCSAELQLTHDLQRNTRFSYWRCPSDQGRLTSFFDFLKEKSFIRTLTSQQLDELRQNVQTVNCSNCGAPIDLSTASACTHCGSPISIVDMKQSQQLLDQLKQAAEPKPIDPTLAMDLALAKQKVETSLGTFDSSDEWWNHASTSGLVEASLGALARWLTKSGI
jgi:DNA-directed RNA polymerase subunit RPC12/RpoP